jgi:hypothetical protein
MWTVEFSEAIGNQPVIVMDDRLLYTSTISVVPEVFDGNNALSEQGQKVAATFPGEAPQNYNARMVGADQFSYNITGLVPGNTYFVAVSAVNAFGNGPTTVPHVSATTPPKQVPQPPRSVSVDVHEGSASTLDVTFAAPLSNGGSPILSYRVELDTSEDFTNPIYNIIPCAAGSTFSVFQVKTTGFPGDPVASGYFGLTLSRNRTTIPTDFISYDATAKLSDEEGIRVTVPGITATLVTAGDVEITASSAANETIFVNDRVQFDNQLYEQQIFTVVNVLGRLITLDEAVLFAPTVTTLTTTSSFYRVYGGRGTVTTSKVACTADSSICSSGRRQISGSMQSKFESIPEAVVKGVSVDRDEPDIYNGVTWRVTFLDNALVGALNFNLILTPGSNQVKTVGGNDAQVTVTNLLTGVTYPTCEGTHEVPTDKALASGQPYYARVSALNEIGYSEPQRAPTSQKPFVTPGAPTSVVLSVVSQTELRVAFNAPADDGGDTITSYQIDYSASPVFATFASVFVNSDANTAKTASFAKTIGGLTTGTPIYVRVSAANAQGYGDTAASVPTSLNPYRPSDAPTQVFLRATSDTMLTVAFSPPLNDGGDAITYYKVEWDITPTFNGAAKAPDRSSVTLDARLYSSYTIQYLTKGRVYYVRVSAVNSAGPGVPALTSPASLAPSLQVPGRPHTIAALSGANAGQIIVSWQRPRIPAHGFPCYGTPSNPGNCPDGIGGNPPQSDGGSLITEYEINYNDLEDFSGFDTGKVTTTKNTYTIQNLTPDRTYYIRVLARNAQGAGRFCQYSEPNCLLVNTPVFAKAKALASA